MNMVFNEYVLDNGVVVTGILAQLISRRGGLSELTKDQLERVNLAACSLGLEIEPYGLGYVYVIQDDVGAFKVGWSKQPTKRCLALKTSNPHNLKISGVFAFWGWYAGFNPETACQEIMAVEAGHLAGEWFSGTGADHLETLAAVCAKNQRYVRLKDAIRKSLEIWPVFMDLQYDARDVERAKAKRTEVVSLTKILGKDWEY